MSYRFITKSIHAYVIDYPFAIVLIAAPFVLKLGQSEPVAMWLSVVVGVAALLLAALTDHPTGLVRIIPYWLHLWVDRAVGVDSVLVRSNGDRLLPGRRDPRREFARWLGGTVHRLTLAAADSYKPGRRASG